MKKDRRTDDSEGRIGGAFEGNGVNVEGVMVRWRIQELSKLRLIAFCLLRSRRVPIPTICHDTVKRCLMEAFSIHLSRSSYSTSQYPYL